MSARILTREQLAELAALETTQGSLCVMEMGDTIRLTPDDFSRPCVVAVMPPRGWLAPGDPTLLAAAPDLLATALDRDLRILDLERRLDLRESALSDAGADLHALTEEARELGTDAHPDDLRAFVSRLVDVYAGAAGRAVVEERDALRAEAARLRTTVNAMQVAQAVTLGALAVQEQVRARPVPSYHAPIGRHVVDPERIRAAVIEAIEAVHVAPPTWVESVADDVLARLQAPTSKAGAPQPDPLPADGDVWAELIDGEPVAGLRALYRERRALGIERYGVPLQRGNGRDHRADLLQELLDGMAYAAAAGIPSVVERLREVVRDVLAGPSAHEGDTPHWWDVGVSP